MRRLIVACWLLLAAALTFVGADVGQVPKAGGGGSTSLASGSTPVTGCQNLVLYGNNSNLVECEAAFGYTTASNTATVDNVTVATNATFSALSADLPVALNSSKVLVSDNPITRRRMCDDFGFASQGISNTLLSEQAWQTGVISTGTITQQNPNTRINSHATNDNSGGVVLHAPLLGGTFWTDADWLLDVVFTPGSNSTAITNIGMYIGISQAATADANASSAGIRIRYDTDDSDATYIFQTCDSATNGCASAADDTNNEVEASTIAPVAGTSNRFRIQRRASGVGGNPTIYFSVDDETPKTFCSAGCDASDAQVTGTAFFFAVQYLTRTTTGVLSGDLDLICQTYESFAARY